MTTPPKPPTDAPTAKPRSRRAYRLSPEGLEALRAAARRNKPWERSTGPRTREGKVRLSRNALKHGERSTAAEEGRAIRAKLSRVMRD